MAAFLNECSFTTGGVHCWMPAGAQRQKFDVFAKVLRRTRLVSNTAAHRNSGSLSLSSLNGDNDKSAVPDTGSPPTGPAVDEP